MHRFLRGLGSTACATERFGGRETVPCRSVTKASKTDDELSLDSIVRLRMT